MKGWAHIRSGLAFRLARQLRQTSVTASGDWGRFRGDTDDGAMLRHYGSRGSWSAGTVALLAETARELVARGEPAPLLVDVGAAIGLVSIGVLRQAPGRALAIESHPEVFPYLQYNVAKNRMLDRIDTMQVAAGNPTTSGLGVRMQRTPGNGGDNWVVTETDDDTDIPLLRIDDFTAQYPDVSLLLKIDVQGYEPQVLAGGLETLRRARLAVIEFWPYGLRRMGSDPTAFARQLLDSKRPVAVMQDEHRVQPVDWITTDTAMTELAGVIEDGSPERQLELLFGAID